MRGWRCKFVAGKIFFIVAVQLGVGAAVPEPRSFQRQAWTTDQGLPANHITTLGQTRDQYLWIGTHFGLVRFDGARFTTFNQANTVAMQRTGDAVTSLAEARDGVLWIATSRGLLALQDGTFTAYYRTNGLAHDTVLSLAPAREGGVWVGTESGVSRLSAKAHEATTIPFFANQPIDAVLESSDGAVWVGTRIGLFRFRAGGEDRPELVHRVTKFPAITRLVEDTQGRVWFNVVSTNVVYRVQQNTVEALALPASAEETKVHANALMAVSDGVVVFAPGGAGIFRGTNSEWEPLSLSDGASSGGVVPRRESERGYAGRSAGGTPALQREDWAVACVLPMDDGSFWIGTKESGLLRFSPQLFRTYVAATPKLARVWSVSISTNDVVWLGTDGGVVRMADGELRPVPFANPPEVEMTAHAVFVDQQNNVWAAAGGRGVWKFDGTNMVQQFKTAEISNGRRVFSLAQDRDGKLWFGSDNDAYRFDGVSLKSFRFHENFPDNNIHAITVAGNGAVWLGTAGAGLWRMLGEQRTSFTTSNGLAHDRANVIHEDEAGHLWIGTENGLSLYENNRWFTFRKEQGLHDNIINHLEEDAFGRMWFSGNRGVSWMMKAELLEVAAGKRARANHVAYGERDGMLSGETNGERQPAGAKDSRGRIWFPTQRGVVCVDPAAIPPAPQPPKVIIESVVADGEVAYHDSHSPGPSDQAGIGEATSDGIHLPPGRGRFLEIIFTAPVFEQPDKVRFEYRLEGYDDRWIEAGARRNAHYSNLRPGLYRFRVKACNSRGVWNEAGAAIAFTLRPKFFQTWWFRGLLASGFAGVGLAFILYRLRVQKRFLALERDAALEQQRARIAQDMHDELGASLTKIAILSEVAKREGEQRLPLSARMDAISDTAREVVDGLSQMVWTVNPANDSLESLCAYLREYAGGFFDGTLIQCDFDIPMELPDVPVTAEFRRNIFLAAKEILTNVARHSSASHVRVEIRVGAGTNTRREFMLRIGDDGGGFDAAQVSRFSNGIESVRKRIARVGGTTTVNSALGKGTDVTLVVPLPVIP